MPNRGSGPPAQGPACGKWNGPENIETSWSTLHCTAHGEQGRRRAAAQQHIALQMTEEGQVVSVPCSTMRRNGTCPWVMALHWGGGGVPFVDESGMKRGGTQIKSAPHQHVLFCSVLWAGAGPHHQDQPIQGTPPRDGAIRMGVGMITETLNQQFSPEGSRSGCIMSRPAPHP